MLAVFVLAVVLALDAAAAAMALATAGASRRRLLAAVVLFGLFQAGMAAVGAQSGEWPSRHAGAWDHWIALGLLVLVGGRMMAQGWGSAEDADPPEVGAVALLALAVATSIDALAAGVSLPLLSVPVLVSVGVVGVVTVALSALGAVAGAALGRSAGGRVEVVGGALLVLLGVKLAAEHTGWL
jgi:putative Mn2+ efflux pump MntP